MVNVLLVSDNSDGNNWGCTATSRKLRDEINYTSEIKHTVFLEDLRYNDLSPSIPKRHDLTYVLSEYIKIFTGSGNVYDRIYDSAILSTMHFFDFLPKTIEQYPYKSKKFMQSRLINKYFNKPSEIDEVIINGEGSIHGNRRKSQMLLFLAYVSKFELGINTHIVNHTLQIDTPELKKMIGLIYPQLDTIVFRDPISVNEYKSKIGEGNIIRAADAAWLFDDFVSPKYLNKLCKSGGIDIWVSDTNYSIDFEQDYICLGGGSGFNHGSEKVANNFIRLVNSIQSELQDTKILLTAAASSDQNFMLKVSEKTGAPLISLQNDIRIAASVVANSSVYVGGRWHPTIFALLGNTQLVNFSGNTFKIQSIKKQFGTDHPIFACKMMSDEIDSIVRSVVYAINEGYDNVILTDKQILKLRNKARLNVPYK